MRSTGTFHCELYVQSLDLGDAHRLNSAMRALTELNPQVPLSRQPAVGTVGSLGVAFRAKAFFHEDRVISLMTVPQPGLDRVVVTADLPALPTIMRLKQILDRLKGTLGSAWATWSWELNPE